MKIAIVRGVNVNDWELQRYVPLQKSHSMIVIGALWNEYSSVVSLLLKKLLCLDTLFQYIPGGTNFLQEMYGDSHILTGLHAAVDGYDIIDTAERTNYFTVQAVRAKQAGLVKKVVVHCWENILHFKEGSTAQKLMKREIDAGADLFIAGTKAAKQVLLDEGISEDKITVIPHGVNMDHFTVRKGVIKKDITVLFAGRMIRGKGIYVLYSAAKDIIRKQKKKDLSFVFMGEGPEKESLQQLIRRENMGKWIKVKDGVSYTKLRNWYRRAEMVVLPSISTPEWIEQFGLVLTEAMACGTVVIGSRIGSIPEIVGRAGILVEPGNSRKLAKAILKLHSHKRLRKRMEKEGRERIMSHFSTNIVSQKLQRMYEHVSASYV